MKRISGILKSIGPGILFACITVGGTHFVQSTHAGTDYGFKIIPLVLLVYILKYPFFEFAQRFSTATKQTLLQGYLHLGRLTLFLYVILVACTAFPTMAALSLINANLTAYFLNTTISPSVLSIALFILCALILLFGKYPWLDKTIKMIMLILITSTFSTFFIALSHGVGHVFQAPAPGISTLADFTFLLAMLGWMPAPIDASVWTTLWAKARAKQTHYHPTLKEGLFDFNLGYLISAVLAVMFIALGAIVMFSTGQSFSKSGIVFMEQLINLFTTHIGKWSETFIAITIFSVMYSTTLTCLDAYPRALTNALTLAMPKIRHFSQLIYWVAVLLLFFIGVLLSSYFSKSMKQLVDIATILAFLTAPIFGYLNYRVVTDAKIMPKEAAPPKFLVILSKIGLVFLITISVLFIISIIL